MRMFFARFLIVILVLIATETNSRSDGLFQFIDDVQQGHDQMRSVYLKNLYLIGDVDFWTIPSPTLAKVLAEKVKNDRIDSRCFVTRKRGEKVPTWDGYSVAIIFDPLTWYFDPDSQRHEMRSVEMLTGPKFELSPIAVKNTGWITIPPFFDFMMQRSLVNDPDNRAFGYLGPHWLSR